MIRRWDSVGDYVRHATDLAEQKKFDAYYWSQRQSQADDRWDLGVNGKEAARRGLEGDPALLDQAQTFLDGLETSMGEEPIMRTVGDVTGGRVCVPDYLAGSPTCMRRRVRRAGSVRHVNVYVDLVSSASVSAQTLLKRGTAIIGLLEALQAARISVQLFLVAGTSGPGRNSSDDKDPNEDYRGDFFQVIRVESQPLDLTTASFALAHPAFARNVTYCVAHANGCDRRGILEWPDSATKFGCYATAPNKEYTEHLRRMMQLEPQDLWIPPTGAYDTLVTDPQRWILERVKQAVGATT